MTLDTRTIQDMVTPIDGRILVEEDSNEKTTQSGILLPDGNHSESFRYGHVVAVGPGKMTDYGMLLPPKVSVGDRVAFADNVSARMVVLGKSYLLLREGNIVAVVRGA